MRNRGQFRARHAIAAAAGSITLASTAACTSFSAADVDGGTAASLADASGDGASPADGGTSPADGGADATDAGLKLVAFVTGVGYADIATPLAGDAKCQAEATGRLTGKFVAWLSSAGAGAASRLVDSSGQPIDGPWFRVDGARIVATRAALLDTATTPLENAITLTATGSTTSTAVWTGTHADGGAGNLCPQTNAIAGAAPQTGPAWTEQTFFTPTCPSSLAVYCFQVQ